MSLILEKITNSQELEQAFEIRRKVFVLEQKVDASLERDQFEETSSHFLVKFEGQPVGAARWRMTDHGIKLERFAVLKEFRGKGLGQALVKFVLEDIRLHTQNQPRIKYLNAQLEAVSLYEKFGFQKVGGIFEECNILHYKMELN